MAPIRRNYDMNELKRLDLAHHLPAQTDYQLQHQLGGSRIITHADGCVITDAEGHAMLDGMAGLWCVNVGYGRTELAEAAYQQMCELPFYNTLFKTATPPPVMLAAKIAQKMQIANPDLTHVFFNSSGSEANDTVFRLTRHYWALKGEPQRQVFISRHNAYHGSTVAGASLGGMSFMHEGGLPIAGIEHVAQPYSFNHGFGEDEEVFCDRMVAAIEERILKVGPDKVAAFIGEPVQGAGGVIIPPKTYWPKVEALCRKYGILLICDEVICGFGRLGHWFGHAYYGIKPDLIAMAKGLSSGYLPVSAVGVSSKIVDLLIEKGGDFVHGFTYSGHPTCCAVALKNIEIMEREGLIERTKNETGPYLAEAIKRLGAHELVGEARSIGLLGAIEIVREKGTNLRFKDAEGTAGPIVRDICIKNGLMVRAIRDSIVMCPPLIVSLAQIDQMMEIITRSLDEAAPVLRGL